jgi:hypothetical protein
VTSTPKGKAEVMKFAKELLEQEKRQSLTTEGITREDVDKALALLGMHNPKPEIPIEGTLNGHLIVALSRVQIQNTAMISGLWDALEEQRGEDPEAQRTTVAVTREDVDEALAYLGIDNPIPGHFAFPDRLERSLVGIADTLKRIEARIPKRGDIVA